MIRIRNRIRDKDGTGIGIITGIDIVTLIGIEK